MTVKCLNLSLLFFFFRQYSRGTFVHPSGTERTIHQCIDAMERLYGDRQGKQFKVWVDRVSSAQIGSDTWLVKCDKWESFGKLVFRAIILVSNT